MAAKNPIRFRAYSTGGATPRAFRLWRDSNKIIVQEPERGSSREHIFGTVSAAKRAMDLPELICK